VLSNFTVTHFFLCNLNLLCESFSIIFNLLMVRDSFIYLLILSVQNNFKISLEIVLYYHNENFYFYWFSCMLRSQYRKVLILVQCHYISHLIKLWTIHNRLDQSDNRLSLPSSLHRRMALTSLKCNKRVTVPNCNSN